MSMPIQRQSEQFSVFDTGTRWARDNEPRDLPKGLAGLVNSMGPRVGAGMLNTRTAAEGDDGDCAGCDWNHDDDDKPMTEGCWDAIAGKGKKREAGWHYPEYDPRVDGYPEEDLDRPTRAELDAEEYEDDEDRDYLRALDGQDPGRFVPEGDVDPRTAAALRRAQAESDEDERWRTRERPDERFPEDEWGDPDFDYRKTNHEGRIGSRHPFELTAGWADDNPDFDDILNHIDEQLAAGEPEGLSDYFNEDYLDGPHPGTLPRPGSDHDGGCAHCGEQSTTDDDGYCDGCGHQHAPEELSPDAATHRRERYEGPPFAGATCDHCGTRHDEPFQVNDVSVGDDHKGAFCDDCVQDLLPSWYGHHTAASNDDVTDAVRKATGINLSMTDAGGGSYVFDGRLDDGSWIVASDSEGYQHGDMNERTEQEQQDEDEGWGGPLGWSVGIYRNRNEDGEDTWMGQDDSIHHHHDDRAYVHELPRVIQDALQTMPRNQRHSSLRQSGIGDGSREEPSEYTFDWRDDSIKQDETDGVAHMTPEEFDAFTNHNWRADLENGHILHIQEDDPTRDDLDVRRYFPSIFHHNDPTGNIHHPNRPDEPSYETGVGKWFDTRAEAQAAIEKAYMEKYPIGSDAPRAPRDSGVDYDSLFRPDDLDEDFGHILGRARTAGWADDNPDYDEVMRHIDEQLAAGEPEDKSDYDTDYYHDGYREYGGHDDDEGDDAPYDPYDHRMNPEDVPPHPDQDWQQTPDYNTGYVTEQHHKVKDGRHVLVEDHRDPSTGEPDGWLWQHFDGDPFGVVLYPNAHGVVPTRNQAFQAADEALAHPMRQRGLQPRTAEVAVDPAAMAPQMPAAGGYQPGHRVGLPWRGDVIRGTVIGLDGNSAAVRWDDGQYSSEEPHNIQLL